MINLQMKYFLLFITFIIISCNKTSDEIKLFIDPYYTYNKHVLLKISILNNTDSDITFRSPFSLKKKYLRKYDEDDGLSFTINYENKENLYFKNNTKIFFMDDVILTLKKNEMLSDFYMPMFLYHFEEDTLKNYSTKSWKTGKYNIRCSMIKDVRDSSLDLNTYKSDMVEFYVYDYSYFLKKTVDTSKYFNDTNDSLSVIICPLRDIYDQRDISILVYIKNISSSVINIRSTHQKKLSVTTFLGHLFYFEIYYNNKLLEKENLAWSDNGIDEPNLLYSIMPGESLTDIVTLNLSYKTKNSIKKEIGRYSYCWLWDKGEYTVKLKYKHNDYIHFKNSWQGEALSNKIKINVE